MSQGDLRADIALVLVTLIGAIGWIISKFALAEFSAYTFLAMRFILASAALVPLCWTQLRQLGRGEWLRSLLTGLVFGAGLLLWVVGLKETTNVGVAAFIISLNVVAVPIISRILFAHKITPGLLLALIPAVIGLALLSLDENLALERTQLLFLIAMVAFSAHLALTSHYVQEVPPIPLSVIQLGAAGLMALVAALVVGEGVGQASTFAWGCLLASALFATSLRFWIQTGVVQRVSASHASMIFLAEPVWTALLALWLLNEVMTTAQVLGCLLILGALVGYRTSLARRFLRYWRKR